ncbi:MAG: amino acid permease [Deltaproteobacteria bacterium]|nr:amino acid permease [Deltaproteobacteria bacterium]
MKRLFRRKTIQAIQEFLEASHETQLKRSLTAFDLTCLGIGGIIGVGIFVITGVAAAKFAGPAVILSFVISMFACIFTALCYAEFAALIPISGSAYSYSYATLGEFFAWIIGWDLVLEYMVGSIAVAIGWSGYVVSVLKTVGLELPVWCSAAPGAVPGAIINLPAALIVLALTVLLTVGIKESAKLTSVMVFVKIAAVLIFIAIGFSRVDPANWHPFMPFGFGGVITGAAIVFFAYIGFDAVSTAAEEAKNPKRDLPIGIIASLVVCTILYIAVAAILTGVVSYTELNLPAPIAYALQKMGFHWGAALVSAGAVTGLTSVLIVLLMGQPRIFFAMSRDGLIWPWGSKIHPKYKTPYRTQIMTGIIVASFAAFIDIGTAAELTNIGTLFAFVLVCGGVLVLRYTDPNLKRPFRVPFVPLIPVLGIVFCVYLMISLPVLTWYRFLIWLGLGLLIYFGYGMKHSRLAQNNSK